MSLKLYRATGNGHFLTLACTRILMDIVEEAILEVGVNPSDVIIKIRDGHMGAVIDIMFPTPHTFLFDGLHIKDEHVRFVLGNNNTRTTEDQRYSIPIANPNVVDEIVKAIKMRAKNHRKTRSAINCS